MFSKRWGVQYLKEDRERLGSCPVDVLDVLESLYEYVTERLIVPVKDLGHESVITVHICILLQHYHEFGV